MCAWLGDRKQDMFSQMVSFFADEVVAGVGRCYWGSVDLRQSRLVVAVQMIQDHGVSFGRSQTG